MSGLSKTDWTWTVKSGDFDGDGRIDLFFPTGHTRDFNHSDYRDGSLLNRIGKNTPFLGLELPGKVRYTLVEGTLMYEAH